MARKTKSAVEATAPEATTVEAAAPAANPFAALAQATTAPAAVAPKMHALAVAGETLKAANHVATFKGVRPVAAGGPAFALTGNVYNPAAGHVNATQWGAVLAAVQAHGGAATVAQVAAAFAAAGLAAGLAPAFVKYRAKGAKPNLAQVA